MAISWFGRLIQQALREGESSSSRKIIRNKGNKKGNAEISNEQYELNLEAKSRIMKGINQLKEMQETENDRWYNLQKRGIVRAPAIFKYNPQIAEIAAITAEATSINPHNKFAMDKFNKLEIKMDMVYNNLKAFLNEPTSIGQKAEWWQAKYFESLQGGPWQVKNVEDSRASETWEALRRYMETPEGKVNISNFGSQQAFNMLYNYSGPDTLLQHLQWVMDEDSHDQGEVPGDFFTTIKTW